MKRSPLQSSLVHRAWYSVNNRLSVRALIVVSMFAILTMLTACSSLPSALSSQSGSSGQVQSVAPTISPELAKYLEHNLIVNGDAEGGPAGDPAGTPEQQVVKSLPGWTRTGSLTVYPYVAGTTIGGVGEGDPRPEDHGKQFFAGGPDGGPNAVATATQRIDLSPLALVTDTGNLSYSLSGYLGGWGSYSNQAEVSVKFEGADQKDLGSSAHIGPVTSGNNHQPDLGTGLWQRTAGNKIPVGTRTVVVTLTISVDPQERVAADNSANSGFADSLSFLLKV